MKTLPATDDAGPDGIRGQSLERCLFVAQYAPSHPVARMEKVGLVRRAAANGAGLHARIWQVHAEKIQTAFPPGSARPNPVIGSA